MESWRADYSLARHRYARVLIESTTAGPGPVRLLAPPFVGLLSRGRRIGLARLKAMMESGQL